MSIEKIKFNELGLVQAIIQDYYSKQVLMCAYMNKESLKKTIETGETWFYSRSRQELWHKGGTSGNTQKVISIKIDCDGDALLVEVIKKGPACHLGAESCFDEKVYEDSKVKDFSFRDLFNLIKARKNTKKEGSYTTYLFEKGIDKILKKIGEESAEVIIAAKSLSKEETIYEISDLTYHLFVLMVEMGIEQLDIFDMLASRYLK